MTPFVKVCLVNLILKYFANFEAVCSFRLHQISWNFCWLSFDDFSFEVNSFRVIQQLLTLKDSKRGKVIGHKSGDNVLEVLPNLGPNLGFDCGFFQSSGVIERDQS